MAFKGHYVNEVNGNSILDLFTLSLMTAIHDMHENWPHINPDEQM